MPTDEMYGVFVGDKESESEDDWGTCDKCGDDFNYEELSCFDDACLCQECLDKHTVLCDECGNRIWDDDCNHLDGRILCGSCYDSIYLCCTNCGDTIHRERAHFLEDDEFNETPYCLECYTKENEEFIKSYDFKPFPDFYGDGVFYGVELEIDGGGKNRNKAKELMEIANQKASRIYCKNDGSLNCGFEIVSHPMSLYYHMKVMPWSSILAEAVAMGYKSHSCDTCGLHVHVGRKSLGNMPEDQEDVVARLVFFIEKYWRQMLRFSRRSEGQINKWAARYNCLGNPKVTLESAKKSNLGRYVSLNLQNDETVEFRIFRGTLRYQTFIATLQLVDEICLAAMHLTDEEFEMLSWDDFVKRINPKNKPELISYLIEKQLYGEER